LDLYVNRSDMKNRRLLIGALVLGVVLMALSFGAKWIIFSTVLEKDETARQRIAQDEP